MEQEDDTSWWYDYGYRHGIFDRCNGKAYRASGGWHYAALDGYQDAWETNEVKI